MGRAETGPMKFGDDWTGVFIRGDTALVGFGPGLGAAIEILGAAMKMQPHRSDDALERALLACKQLHELLMEAREGTAAPARLVAFDQAVSGTEATR
jgi:hypothetical protein